MPSVRRSGEIGAGSADRGSEKSAYRKGIEAEAAMIQLSIFKWGFWLRVNDFGVAVELDRPKMFSERYGYTRIRRWWRLSLQILPKVGYGSKS
jgi:hypothetical protein